MTTNLIEIQNASGSYVVPPKITGYKVQFCKLWSSDSGRSLSGDNKGTLVGIFPKIILTIGKTTETEMSTLLGLFNQATANVKYYDTERKTVITASFYFGDASDTLMSQKHANHERIEISIIANQRRV